MAYTRDRVDWAIRSILCMDAYQQLLSDIVEAIRHGEVARARRELLRAGNRAADEQLMGAIKGLEIACIAADEDQPSDLLAGVREAAAGPSFGNGLGCALSDAGHLLSDDGLLSLAEVWFTELRANHADAETVTNHAIVLERLGRYSEASDTLRQAIELAPEQHELRLRLASVLAQLGDLDKAAAEYKLYLGDHPQDAHTWVSLAIVECDAGNRDDAERAYWRAAGLEPNNVSLHYNWLITALRAGDPERAGDALRRLQNDAPDDWRTHMAQARMLAAQGEHAEAVMLAAEVFDDCREQDDGTEELEETLIHVAETAMFIAKSAELLEEARDFAEELFESWTFSEPLLDHLRALDGTKPRPLDDFWVMVDALYTGFDEPLACLVSHRVFADNEEHAALLAMDFEQRCGAVETRVEEIERIGNAPEPDHPGVWWRSERLDAYPADEYGK